MISRAGDLRDWKEKTYQDEQVDRISEMLRNLNSNNASKVIDDVYNFLTRETVEMYDKIDGTIIDNRTFNKIKAKCPEFMV